jgi:hypothetical protein
VWPIQQLRDGTIDTATTSTRNKEKSGCAFCAVALRKFTWTFVWIGSRAIDVKTKR